jgi:hypothetical protein
MLRGLVARRSAAAPLRVLRRNLNLHEVSSAGHTERTPNAGPSLPTAAAPNISPYNSPP